MLCFLRGWRGRALGVLAQGRDGVLERLVLGVGRGLRQTQRLRSRFGDGPLSQGPLHSCHG